ncbi:organic solvent tolerance protein [Actinobacillus pleuropneumoniae]|nr:organic solvent tolerance protein [Actinobacillus pleuropneumoniae]
MWIIPKSATSVISPISIREYGSSTDGYATQQFKLGYYQPNYNLSISGKKFQTFDELDVGPYRVLPQIDFNYYNDELVKGGDFKLFAQTARFENDSKLMPKAWAFSRRTDA